MNETAGVTLLNCVLIFAIVLVSGFLHGTVGSGYSIFAMSLMPLFLPYIQAAAINKVAMLALLSLIVGNLFKHVDWKFITLPVISGIIGSALGFYVMMTTNAKALKVYLGIALMLAGLYLLFFNGKIKMKKSTGASIFMGALSGFMGGVFNLSGITLMIYYINVIDDKLEYASSMQATMVIVSVFSIALNAAFGNYSMPGSLTYLIVAVVAALVGAFIGLKALRKINKPMMGKISYTCMIIMGLFLIINLEQILKSIH